MASAQPAPEDVSPVDAAVGVSQIPPVAAPPTTEGWRRFINRDPLTDDEAQLFAKTRSHSIRGWGAYCGLALVFLMYGCGLFAIGIFLGLWPAQPDNTPPIAAARPIAAAASAASSAASAALPAASAPIAVARTDRIVSADKWHIVALVLAALFTVPTVLLLAILKGAAPPKDDGPDSVHEALGQALMKVFDKIAGSK